MEENQRGRTPKKVGGKILHSQTREIIKNLYDFMKKEAADGPILLQKVQERVAKATGVSRSSVQRILKENKQNSEQGTAFSTPRKKWHKKLPKSALDNFDKAVVRRTIINFHRTHGERPTLKSLLTAVKENIEFQGGISTLRLVIREMGFRWRKSLDNRKMLIETHDIKEKRVRFIRTIQQYRKEGRPIIYTDETYVHATHTKPHSWADESRPTEGLLTPISKGKNAIIVHAGNEKGFVKNSLLIYKSGQKSGDYHDSMNFKNYQKWLSDKLIPNLPPKSVLIVDNASYHNKQINPAPNSNSRKEQMLTWLLEHNIPCNDKMFKAELYTLIKLHKNPYKKYYIDSILAPHGHSVLRLPPYHPDLNPIEMIWSLIKNHVALNNTTFNLDDCIKLVEDKVNQITAEEWYKRCQHAWDNEEKYMQYELDSDELTDRFVINVGNDSSDSESADDPTGEYNSDEELSGVEQL